MSIIAGVKGAPDFFPPVSAVFNGIESAMLATAATYGYERVRTPIFEYTEVFLRGVGASTDIVHKEMYTFEDKGGRSLTLRPEGTAGIMRAALQAGVPRAGALPVKVSWAGDNFRHERPQAGRQRSFTQVDYEALGTTDPYIDAELVVLGWESLQAAAKSVGTSFTPETLQVRMNTLGDRGDRANYNAVLNDYLSGFDLPKEVEERRHLNPLRAFDSKAPGMADIMAKAPLLQDHISEEAREHHKIVCELVEAAGIQLIHDPQLVRGLDYYTRTTFEYQATNLGAQTALGGGGRYDGLAEDLGWSESFPGIGLALGVDRIMLALIGDGKNLEKQQRVNVFVIAMEEAQRSQAFHITTDLRRHGISADMGSAGKKLRAQLKEADRSGAAFAVILGEEELAERKVTLKNLSNGEQNMYLMEDLHTLF